MRLTRGSLTGGEPVPSGLRRRVKRLRERRGSLMRPLHAVVVRVMGLTLVAAGCAVVEEGWKGDCR